MVATIRGDKALTVREIDGEVLVLDEGSNRIHRLNRTASLIWQLCEQGAEAEQIAAALAARFDVDEPTALGDVTQTLAKLRALDLVREAS